MKKKHLTIAGIVAALILAGMFIAIIVSAYPLPLLSPLVTIDPITDASVDGNNVLILTGRTTLPEDTYNVSLEITAVSPAALTGDEAGRTHAIFNPFITAADGGRNRWRGACDISGLRPGNYTVVFKTFVFGENFTRTEFPPLATAHFALGEANASGEVIHKEMRVIPPFIRINPAPQGLGAGGYRITGITSLAPGIPLFWTLHAVTDGAGNATQGYEGMTMVTEGMDGVNRWTVRPGESMPAQARYRFTIRDSPSATAPVSDSTEHDVVIPPAPASTTNVSRFITIDALPEIRVNDVYTITGTTSLQPGDVLMFMVHPASFETNFNFSLDAKETSQNRTLSGAVVFSGVAGATDVVNGRGGENLWSFRLETYQLGGGLYQINVTNDGFDYEKGTIIPGDLFATRVMPIAGEVP